MNTRCDGLYAGPSREEITSHSPEVLATAWAECPPYQYTLLYELEKPACAEPWRQRKPLVALMHLTFRII
jgi:hypothetical protein